jgi:hypothetical protein
MRWHGEHGGVVLADERFPIPTTRRRAAKTPCHRIHALARPPGREKNHKKAGKGAWHAELQNMATALRCNIVMSPGIISRDIKEVEYKGLDGNTRYRKEFTGKIKVFAPWVRVAPE